MPAANLLVSGLRALHRILLRMEPETAHDIAVATLRLSQATLFPQSVLRRMCVVHDTRLEQEIFHLRFPNPVGLAAGFDKNAQAIHALAALGFGFLETGTVTPMPQRGNPRPRIFRFPAQQSLQNALGFNNAGVQAMATRLRRQLPCPVPVGVNIGKNRQTSAQDVTRDYELLVDRLDNTCDYFVINVSSPNTPGLRDLQRQEVVTELLRVCTERTAKPVLVKLAPDLDDGQAVELSVAAVESGAAGLVLTNTTTDYTLLSGAVPRGGLSGRVLQQRSFAMLQVVAAELAGRCCLISVGGIDSAAEAYRRLRAGANLVQVYTGMVFQGPLLIRELVRGLLTLMQRDGARHIQEVIGADL